MDKKLVSVIVLVERAPQEAIARALDSIKQQTHKHIEILMAYVKRDDIDSLRERWGDLKYRWLECDQGWDMLEKGLKEADGEYIFYKSLNPISWHPRHIEHHLDLFKWDNKAKWSFSLIELHNMLERDKPFNIFNWRLEKNPDVRSILLDEICHHRDLVPNWKTYTASFDEGKTQQFVPGVIFKAWKDYRAAIPEEITIDQWINPAPPVPKLGTPASDQNVSEEVIELADGQLGIKIEYPTIVGNHEWEQHNSKILERIKKVDPLSIKNIAVKRTMGMGDVILVEPVIKALKKKFSNASVTLFAGKTRGSSEIAQFFTTKPDQIIPIDENQILNDFLYSQKGFDLRFDLDLAYESRKNLNYIDAYFHVAGFKEEVEVVDGTLQLVSPVQDTDKIPSLTYSEPRTILDKYVSVELAGSGWSGKEWNVEKWNKVLALIVEKGYKIAYVSGIRKSSIEGFENDKNDFSTMLNYLRHAEFHVGADNGPMHIAAAFGKKCFILAGAAIPKYTTKNPNVFAVTKEDLPCLHCKGRQFYHQDGSAGISFVSKCENSDSYACMNKLGEEYVLQQFEKFLNENHSL